MLVMHTATHFTYVEDIIPGLSCSGPKVILLGALASVEFEQWSFFLIQLQPCGVGGRCLGLWVGKPSFMLHNMMLYALPLHTLARFSCRAFVLSACYPLPLFPH